MEVEGRGVGDAGVEAEGAVAAVAADVPGIDLVLYSKSYTSQKRVS